MRVTIEPSLAGWRGTVRTIRAMHDLVGEGRTDPTVIFLASRLVRKDSPKDYRRQAERLFEHVQKNVHYVKDPYQTELLRSPFWTLYYGSGDCDDQAVLFSALAQAIGFRTRFKTIKADPAMPDEFSHVYSQVEVPGRGWLSADTIVPYATLGWETQRGTESKTWGGGAGMLGTLGQEVVRLTDAEVAKTTSGTTEERTFWGKLFDNVIKPLSDKAVKEGAKQLEESWFGKRKAEIEAAPLGALLPIGIALAAGGTALFLFIRKRKKRR